MFHFLLSSFVFCIIAMSCLGQQLEEYDLDDMNDMAGDKFKKCCDDSGMNCPEGLIIIFFIIKTKFLF
jgi:hypothetical protein